MRRFSYIFTAILGLLITVSIYSEFNAKYYFNLQNFSYEEYDMKERITAFINPSLSNMDMNQLIDSLQEFARDNDVDIHITRGKNDELNRQVIEHFIYSSDFDIDNFIYTDESYEVNFDDMTEEKYYAVSSNDDSAIKIKVLDEYYSSGVLYSLQAYRPLHQLKDVIDDGDIELGVDFYVEDSTTMKNLIQELKQAYSIADTSLMNGHKGIPEEKAIGTNLQLIIILIIINIILISSYINKKLKEISIRRMNGNRNYQIMQRIIGTYMLQETFVFGASVIIAYAILVGEISPMAYNIIEPLGITCILFILGLVILLGILYVYIRYISSLVSLKKSSVNMKLVFLNLTVKVLLMTIIISPMLSMINEGIDSSRNLYNHLKYHDKDKYRYNVSGTSKVGSSAGMDDIFKISEDYFKALEKEKGIYADFSYSNKEELLLFFGEQAEKMVPYIMVNKEYLKDYEIKNEEGEIIDIESITENTLFIPSIYKNQDYVKLISADEASGDQEMYVEFDRPFYNPDIAASNVLSEDPLVYLAVNFNPSIQAMYGYAYYDDVESLETTLKDMGYENKYRITDKSGIYDYYMKIYIKALGKTLGVILLYVFIILVFLYQSIYLGLRKKLCH